MNRRVLHLHAPGMKVVKGKGKGTSALVNELLKKKLGE